MSLRLAIVSTYPPRRCGLASFAAGLHRGLLAAGAATVEVVAVTRGDEGRYGPEVVGLVRQDRRGDYLVAAELLNRRADVVLLQHEYGIFGGPDGELVLELARALRRPWLATLHTVRSEPTPGQRRILSQLADLADGVVVMCREAARRLEGLYGVDGRRIHHLPHGVPTPPPGDARTWKRHFGLEGRTVVTTFGLIGPGKGIEGALRAVALAARQVPDLLYVVAGSTHPEVRRREGEAYRQRLESLVQRLGLAGHVRFLNRFLDERELLGLLLATDVYLVPYPGREQVSSGTLTFALALGRPVVSTPFAYAQELLAEGAGVLVPWDDVRAMARALVGLCRHPGRRALAAARARARTRGFLWPEVGARYLELARALASAHAAAPVPVPRPALAAG